MQKLVKKTLHYETIMPVEAYHPEDDTWEDEINLALTIGSCVWAIASPDPFGEVACAGFVLNTLAHDEPTVEFVTDVMEANIEADRQRMEQQADMAEAVIDTARTIVILKLWPVLNNPPAGSSLSARVESGKDVVSADKDTTNRLAQQTSQDCD